VLARYFGFKLAIDMTVGKRYFAGLAQSLQPPNNGAAYNQAIMDFGAMICTPRRPRCHDCPLQIHCKAYLENAVEGYPVKAKKLVKTQRFLHYLVPLNNSTTIISQREKGDIWTGLY
jgi:A/G-specific adenine glycosylase